ncbi:HNH endonuclease [Streptomyces cacaoi]|uniref:HNH domain-containing protein n=1 Tax=Streptomyces cacaoi TaxID=1898 RepID=A0A4Y3QYE6_STRCI|nr:hypothetical protein SCA03_29850 [Streptomyces cacaoi]
MSHAPEAAVHGWGSSTRGEHLPSNWAALRDAAWRRHHGLCQHVRYDTGRPCLAPGDAVDHKVPVSQGGTSRPENLWVLCKYHHDKKTAREAAAARRTRRGAAARQVSGERGRTLGSL